MVQNENEFRYLLSKAKKAYKKKGAPYTFCAGIKFAAQWIADGLGYFYYRAFKPAGTIIFQEKNYDYFYHPYNRTWKNERAVEVPIIWDIVGEQKGKRILEVGNVLSHYFDIDHDILDKYERADGVINQDAADFRTIERYDLIVSISTLEHVGWDENPREPEKVLRAIDNLKSLLAPKGKMVVTLPVGQNPNLDKLLRERKIRFTRLQCLERISGDNRWVESDWGHVQNAEYNKPFPAANGLVIGTIEN